MQPQNILPSYDSRECSIICNLVQKFECCQRRHHCLGVSAKARACALEPKLSSQPLKQNEQREGGIDRLIRAALLLVVLAKAAATQQQGIEPDLQEVRDGVVGHVDGGV